MQIKTSIVLYSVVYSTGYTTLYIVHYLNYQLLIRITAKFYQPLKLTCLSCVSASACSQHGRQVARDCERREVSLRDDDPDSAHRRVHHRRVSLPPRPSLLRDQVPPEEHLPQVHRENICFWI